MLSKRRHANPHWLANGLANGLANRLANRPANRLALILVVAGSLGVLSSCTDTAGTVADSSEASTDAPTIASGASLDSSSAAETSTPAPSTTEATTTIPPTTIPPTTIPHGDGVARNLADGTPVSELVLSTANSIYSAAIIHNYDGLRDIIGDRRFRWGFVGERGPTKAWKEQFDAGGSDELARIVKLLELPPGRDARGGTVWPAVALKEPAEWTLEDEAVLAKLGFNPEDIDQTRSKGRYVDYKLVIDANGLWTAFGVGY